MPVLKLKALECSETEDWTHADTCILKVYVDGGSPAVMKKDLNTYDQWILNKTYTFQNQVKIKLWDEDWPDSDDFLGQVTIGPQLTNKGIGKFTKDDADYTLWYEVVDAVPAHSISNISLRQMLGRMGRGVISSSDHYELVGKWSIYKCREVISVRDTFEFHKKQDGAKSNTKSVRLWINSHCNIWGEESVIPFSQIPEAYTWDEIGISGKSNWKAVKNEKSHCVAGFQHYSRKTNTDNPLSHETMDWLWDQILDPPFSYMLSYTAKRIKLDNGKEFPRIHNEWETGSMPIQWRPFWGEYVTTWGRHIFDMGHMPMSTEMHSAHTIVREHTTAAPLGNNGAWVPVNRAIIGMGFSGGFPGDVGSRWNDETNGIPDDIWGDTTDCWATNLKKHTLKFKFFPPVFRPSDTAQLKFRIVLCEYIQVKNWDKVDDFLELCQYDDPAYGGKKYAFRVWNRGAGLPKGFTPKVAPAALRPKFTLRDNAYYEVELNLNPATQIPVAYYALVECGWSERGSHDIYQYDVTFEKVKAVETDEWWDDWHMLYGVNGKWGAWWTDDFVEEGETYTKNRKFRVYTIDNMPLLIRDCGIEWDGTDYGNEKLDRVEITAAGPNHFNGIVNHNGVEVLSQTTNTLRIKAKGWQMKSGDTKHEWTIKLVRTVL